LIGRDDDLVRLDAAWNDLSKNVVVVRAFGGMGKTSLVTTWMATLAKQGWRGAERVFDWTFYSQGTSDQRNASADTFIAASLRAFGDPDPTKGSPWERGERLARLVGKVRCLLVLDGLEPLQYPPGPMQGKLKDPGVEALLKGLVAQNHGLCIVTTREEVTDIQQHYGRAAEDMELVTLTDLAGAALLHHHGARRAGAREILPDDPELQAASREVRGHGLTLQLLGQYLRLAEDGDIRKRDTVRLVDADREYKNDATRPYGHAFKAMEAYERWFEREGEQGKRQLALLRLLGFFDRPASQGCLSALRRAPIIPGLTEPLVDLARREWALTARRLEEIDLLKVRVDGSLDAHPLLREYFGQSLREDRPEAWKAGHQRLFEHLCEATKEGDKPTLENLEPLYQAVAHGCQAGLQQKACEKVYRDRIQRGGQFFSFRKLGAAGFDLGAITLFFETPWSRVSPTLTEADRVWLLHEAATRLGALGRLIEAVEPMRAAMATNDSNLEWENAAVCASNLSELELTLGDISGAVRDAEQSVTYADRSGDAFWTMASRTTHANALHCAGRRSDAREMFQRAELLHAKISPDFPALISLQGFQYCDLLLAESEQQAGKVENGINQQPLLVVCQTIAQRAAQILMLEGEMHDAPLLDFALHHLTLGRSALYTAILISGGQQFQSDRSASHGPPSETVPNVLEFASTEIVRAVTCLRRAGIRDYLPLGLLSRAWLRGFKCKLTGAESAQSDLDEAWDIAERGPMPLFLADIHLYRARLFFREPNYPWQSAQHDLAEARRLIEKHGYWRRKEELEDAERLIGSSAVPKLVGSTISPSPQAVIPAIQANVAETRKAPMETAAAIATIVLVTVNDLETKAVLDAFVGPDRAPAQKAVGGVTYNLLGNHGGMSIVHTIAEMGPGGVGAAQQRTREAIEHWSPEAVIAVGIAFGMDETKQKIGDVLVSTQIQDYELGRLGSDGQLTPRGDKPHASDTLCNRLRQTDAAQTRQFSDWPKVRFGLVLSGQKLVDNLSYRESLKKLFGEAIGGEMEATGLYVSAVTAKVDWIVVKAICDWGHDKNQADKNAWQTLAAKNAVRVLKAAIELGSPFPSGEPSRTPGKAGNVPPTPALSHATSPGAPASSALAVWREKLGDLQAAEALAFDPAAKFKIRKDIEEAKAKIREYGGKL
jgi:nucleoside phosphorylase/tetratricopeptide (TPR) repeat protein